MEAEERPHKIRKLSQDCVVVAEPADEHEESPAQDRKLEVPPANGADLKSGPTSNGDEKVAESISAETGANNDQDVSQEPMSKNALKKIRKSREWEDGREYRKAKKKQKLKERRARKRTAKEEAAEDATVQEAERKAQRARRPIRLPVTFIIDCGFDDFMTEKERISLGSQLTRSYSDNSKAPFQAHLAISSWGGALKDRFDTILSQHYKNWKGVQFEQGDFVKAAEAAKEKMSGPHGGRLVSVFEKYATEQPSPAEATPDKPAEENVEKSVADADPSAIAEVPNLEANEHPAALTSTQTTTISDGKAHNVALHHDLPDPEVVYLTSDSPYTLDELKPYSTYIIGGLVDKNRHKGISFKTASDKNIKTAKLPIGDYMEMQSRFVLATNHVAEIMVRWLECGDWGQAFMQVIPKRKGGKLRPDVSEQGTPASHDENPVDSEDVDDA